MYIDKFQKEGSYYDEDGCCYETAEDFYQSRSFNFCGCGSPDKNLEYIRDGLAHIDKTQPENISREEYHKWYDEWKKEGHEIFGNEKARYFFFYWADMLELTEHGGSVPGWLTEKGRETLADLREICDT